MNLEGYTQAQAQMLRYVFHNGQVSRAQLAQALDVSNLTVINGVKRLLEDKLLIECGTLPSERGRRVTLLSVNSQELSVERTALGSDAPILGAALLAIFDLLKRITDK